MIVPGVCSVSFRSLTPVEVVAAAVAAGLGAVEWGGDVHVPAGDLGAARAVAARSCDAGLAVASYGSYLAAGAITGDGDVQHALDTAVALGAPHVRVWCAPRVDDRGRVAADLRTVADGAAERGLAVSTEFHPGTLTETAASTVALLEAVGAANLGTYWQPHPRRSVEENLAELASLGDRVTHVHVFRWRPDGERLPLSEGADLWPAAFALVGADGRDRVAFVEFVRGDDPAQLVDDARALRAFLCP